MATQITVTQVEGFGVPDARISEDTLQPDGTFSADYTQAGAYAGQPEAQQDTPMALEATGEQTDGGHLRLKTIRAGGAGLDEGAFLWRDVAAGDATNEYRGADGFQVVSGIESLFRSTGSAGGSLPDVIRLASSNVLCAYNKASAADNGFTTHLYKPSTGAWTAQGDDTFPASDGETVALCEIPEDERVLLFTGSGLNVHAMYSDDEGASWATGARSVLREELPSGASIKEVRAAYSAGEVLLVIQYDDGGTQELAQYASTDQGTRFSKVFQGWTESGDEPDAISVTALRGGGFAFAYHDGQASSPVYHYKRIGSAFESLDDAEVLASTSAGAGGRPSVALWQDEDSVLYSLTGRDTGSSYETRLERSTDRGTAWAVFGGPVAELKPGAQDTELNEFAATSTGGLGILVTRYTAPNDTGENRSVVCIYLGGSTSHTVPATDEQVGGTTYTDFRANQYVTWGQSDDNGRNGGVYLPVEEPQNIGWTAAGGGSESITSAQKLEIVTSAQTRPFRRQFNDTAHSAAVGEIDVELDSGSGDDSTREVALTVRLTDYDGVSTTNFNYEFSIRLDDAGFSVYDENGSQVGSPVAEATTSGIKIRWVVTGTSSSGAVQTWYTTDGPQDRLWTTGPGGSLTKTTDNESSEIEFGHAASGTATSRWSHVGYCFWPWRWALGTGLSTTGWTNPDDLHGRYFSAYPLWVADNVKIAAKDGPAFYDDQWTVKPEHTYSVKNICIGSASSPRRGWRSIADGSVMYIPFDLDDDFASTKLGNHTLVVWLMNSNLESVELQTYDGAAWQALVTITSTDDWDSLQYDRRGRTVIPRSGVATTGERYFHYYAHEGDTFDLGTGDADALHLIERNTAGAWIGQTETKKPVVTLAADNMPGGLADQAFGTGKIRRKNFGAVVHSYNDDHAGIRLKIPSQSTAQGDYRIGSLFIGHLEPFARPHDHGHSRIHELHTQRNRTPGGASSARRLSSPSRIVEITWADGWSDATQIRNSQPDPDFIRGQTSVGLAIGTPRDTIETVAGIHEEQADNLVLYIGKVPIDTSASHPLSEPREVVYGRLETNPRFDNALGRIGTDDANRLNTVLVREER